jgi:hypothetical protein
MKKLFIIFLVLLSGNSTIFSQDTEVDSVETTESSGIVLFPNRELEFKIRNSLRAIQMIIKLKTHPLLNLNSAQRDSLLRITDTIKYLNNTSSIDSFSVTLKSGISWDPGNSPPPQPKNFYFKILSKKGRKEQAVIDRLKYLQFCYDWQEESINHYDKIEKFNTYYAIIIDDLEYVVMAYEIIFNPDSSKKLLITNKRIEFYNNMQSVTDDIK